MDMRDNLDKLKNFRLLLMEDGKSTDELQGILQGVVEVLIDVVQPQISQKVHHVSDGSESSASRREHLCDD